MPILTDQARMDWLERMAKQPGGLLLHDGSETGRLGLGLSPGTMDRSLRDAIDKAMRFEGYRQPPQENKDRS